jgi:hypothetical protein
MMAQYTHPALGEEVQTHGGYFIPKEERLLPYGGREILYIVGDAVIESSCCGTGSWIYIQVPGFVDSGGPPWSSKAQVSYVEPIRDHADRENVLKLLLERHPGARIEIF